jgi:hypothetical protein
MAYNSSGSYYLTTPECIQPLTAAPASGAIGYIDSTQTQHAATALAPTSITLGSGLHAFTRHTTLTATLSPSAVAANTCAAQTGITFTGVAAGDIVLNPASAKATDQTGLALHNVRVTAANTVSLFFCNVTASSITPTASETYTLDVEQ